ncbi:acyl-CoA thioesterase [Lysinibacillus sp. NPDC093712]|uniref:acyl-CoA thioesterase n=1 Tax=Lysinibacillus sp. NPDC093712 TaxID=3390579 RepID=UPI003CFED172
MTQIFVFKTTPRFSDTDAYGIVHHSNYYKILEEARINFAKSVLDLSMKNFDELGYQFPVIKSECNYKIPIFYEDNLRIEVKFSIEKAAKLNFFYKIYNDTTNQIHADAKTSHVFVEQDGKLCLIYPEWFISKLRLALDKQEYQFDYSKKGS